MEEAVDAGTMANLIVRIGLLEENTARECVYEVGGKSASASDLVQYLQRKSMLTPLQGSKLLKGDKDGFILGGYRVLYKISSGTFGRVYRGDDPRSGQVVAIKVLRRKWTDDPQKVDQFMREGRIGLTLQHPNIVGMLAVNQDKVTGQYYIVMEFVEGGNLRDILTIRKKLEVDEALRMMEECAAGLAYAWSRGLTHRDIKASNILISTDKTTKLVDFGLAEMSIQNAGHMEIGRASDKDEDVAIDRTIDYAGLEKATNITRGDVRSDIYFLGHVLYEMVIGEPLMPVTKDRATKLQRRRYEQVESTLAMKAPEVGMHPSLQRLIARAVSFEPSSRYQTPAQFLETIRATRAELSGNAEASRRAAGALTIYIVEQHVKLQDVFRDKFKKLGFRVLISVDANQALKRYQSAPFHALLVDGGTAGRDGVEAYRKVLREAASMRLDLAGALMLNEDQAGWENEVRGLPGGSVLIRPVTMKQLAAHYREALPEIKPSDHDEGE
ncbi:serine/threonine-protein kinase [Fimbriiglobus ruber]|uniref:Serine/threonine protein kinase n=1 Tax=Fimbriiglobus ruber TaxID=1908690 RepID=A0A225EFR7_9BACT|nr:serine/threonine-protein kinase [Fimbriiglobus ruber]OWK47087.1 serine/threonine protein kinase [Fimbriiglobus ruber]